MSFFSRWAPGAPPPAHGPYLGPAPVLATCPSLHNTPTVGLMLLELVEGVCDVIIAHSHMKHPRTCELTLYLKGGLSWKTVVPH